MIPGMGKDAPAQPVPQVEAEKTGKSLNQDKKVEPEEKTAKRRGRPPKEQDDPQGGKAEKGPKPRKGRPAKADKASLDKSPAPGVLDKVSRGGKRDKETGAGGVRPGVKAPKGKPPRPRRRRLPPRRSSCRPRRRCRPARWNREKSSI